MAHVLFIKDYHLSIKQHLTSLKRLHKSTIFSSSIMIAYINQNINYLIELAFKEDATAIELFYISCGFAVLWGIVFTAARPILSYFTYGKPWLYAACLRHYNRGGRAELEAFGMIEKDWSKEEVLEKMMLDWPFNQVLMLQHTVGAMLCLPSLLGYGNIKWASSLACMGVLSEVGWEIESVFEFGYIRLFTKNGDKKVPIPFIIVLAVHHTLASCLGLPMVLHYRQLRALHWLCFDLQFGATMIAFIEYSKTLDLSKAGDLRKFKFVNLLMLIMNVWTRCFHFGYIVIQIILVWYRDEAWMFLKTSALPIIVFTLFNAFVSVIPTYQRFMKFLHKSIEHESLPKDASEKMRRQSVANLEIVANEMLMEGSLDMNDRVQLFFQLLEKREKMDRRQTMPAQKINWRSAKFMRALSTPVISTHDD